MATLTGKQSELEPALEALALPAGAEVLGPVPTDAPAPGHGSADEPEVRALLRAPAAHRKDLVAALRVMAAGRSAHKQAAVRVRVDPAELG
jgi:primosomal protein N' (replication factor Y)